MTRLEYWIKADTQYTVHSPFVFDMYRKVLFARLSRQQRQRVRAQYGSDTSFYQTLYKIADHYHMRLGEGRPDCCILEGDGELSSVMLVNRPHANLKSEAHWDGLKSNADYQISIDLYDVGLLIRHPKLHRQHFMLK